MRMNNTDLATSFLTSTTSVPDPDPYTTPEAEVVVVEDFSVKSTTNVDRLDYVFIAIIILAFLLIVAVVCR